jgi:hypothetical protein
VGSHFRFYGELGHAGLGGVEPGRARATGATIWCSCSICGSGGDRARPRRGRALWPTGIHRRAQPAGFPARQQHHPLHAQWLARPGRAGTRGRRVRFQADGGGAWARATT